MKRQSQQIRNRRKQKRETKWLNVLKKQALEFCRETTLHGYKYIGQTERSKIERIIWAITVFTSLCFALVLMKFAWDYYIIHPTLTVIETTHHGIWNYPFPAVTVCDINRVSLNLTRQLVEKLKLPSRMSKEFVVNEMRLLNELLTPGTYTHDIRRNLSQLQSIIDYNKLSIPELMELVTPNCESLIQTCKWKSELIDCRLLFQRSLTRHGLCCSFNYITLETIAKQVDVEPKRITACGYQTGLTVLVNLEPDDYHATIFGAVGIKVMLHDPYNYPDYNAPNMLVDLDTQLFLTVDPEETYSAANIRNLVISTRNCIFDDEEQKINNKNQLDQNFIFARYSYLNCMTKCRATVIRKKCGCVPYYIPQNATRTCSLRDVTCLKVYKAYYDTSWPGVNMTAKIQSRTMPNVAKRPCGCMPDCNFYHYSIESSRGKLDRNLYVTNLSFTAIPRRGEILQNKSVVHVFFGDLVSTQFRRNVHYNWRNLFATFGGLLGLFSGFSLMSLFELIYFFIIRVVVNAWTKRERVRDTNNLG